MPPLLLSALLFCFLLAPNGRSAIAATAQVPSYTAVLADGPARKTPVMEFDCHQDVYVFFTWYGLSGLHQITALWYNPGEKQESQIDLKFIAAEGKTENWVALKLLDLKREKNPVLPSLASSKFIGKWETRIYLDGNFLEKKNFEVRCD
ncbi:MAG: hypothetical protein HY580_01785 [Nitrospinae bacterium]|nr:hypothetical protein [Nitrospinota bacterium]